MKILLSCVTTQKFTIFYTIHKSFYGDPILSKTQRLFFFDITEIEWLVAPTLSLERTDPLVLNVLYIQETEKYPVFTIFTC